jgi:hypothetical protein
MALSNETYHDVIVESFVPDRTSGLHGKVHIRPVAGQMFDQSIHVECPRVMRDTAIYPLHTKFQIRAKLTDKEGGRSFLYSHHSWKFVVLERPTS